MNERHKRARLRVLVLICTPKLAERAEALPVMHKLPMRYLTRGAGTASSEMMDMMGLGGTAKTLMIAMVPADMAPRVLQEINEALHLGRPDTGIAFTTALNGISNPAMRLMDENMRKEWHEQMENDVEQMTGSSTHALIVAAVDQGFSEEVMEAARSAGAGGGTVVHARRVGGEETMQFWGISIQPEKELVIILTPLEKKMEIMRVIGRQCGIHSEAHGMVFSVPVDTVVGM